MEFPEALLQSSPDPRIWLSQVFLVVLATVSLNFVLMRVASLAERMAGRNGEAWHGILLRAARVPVRLLVWVVGLSVAIAILDQVQDASVFDYAPDARRIAVVLAAALFLSRAVRLAERKLVDPKRTEKPVDETTARAMARLLRVAIAITASLIVVQTLGYSISGALAFGGIGGVAVGFAAKDLLANFFGGLMIYLDKPFSVGDWVRSPDRDIEGTVEDIGWRLTRIRTFELRPLYIPNSLFATISVENPSRMTHRRIYEKLGIRYQDGARMSPVCQRIRQMLVEHPGIDQQEVQLVHFNSYAASHLELMLWCHTRTTAWTEYHCVKEDVLLKIMNIIQEEGAEFAFPTQTLHLARTPPADNAARTTGTPHEALGRPHP